MKPPRTLAMRPWALLLIASAGVFAGCGPQAARPVSPRYQVVVNAQSAVKIDTETGQTWVCSLTELRWSPVKD